MAIDLAALRAMCERAHAMSEGNPENIMNPTIMSLFNHKGGVGKTTIIVNLARAFGQLGCRTMVVDADPQCNATAFYLDEDQLDKLLDEATDVDVGGTLWSAISVNIRGRGDVREVPVYEVGKNALLLPGDVLLARFEDTLAGAWKDCFSRDARAIDLTSALYRAIRKTAATHNVRLVLLDMGPSIGSLNRSLLLSCDYFAVPLASDLFSLRALGTLGATAAEWVHQWSTIQGLSAGLPDITPFAGKPVFLGYMTQHFNIYRQRATAPFEEWERKIPKRILNSVIEPLRAENAALAPNYPRIRDR